MANRAELELLALNQLMLLNQLFKVDLDALSLLVQPQDAAFLTKTISRYLGLEQALKNVVEGMNRPKRESKAAGEMRQRGMRLRLSKVKDEVSKTQEALSKLREKLLSREYTELDKETVDVALSTMHDILETNHLLISRLMLNHR